MLVNKVAWQVICSFWSWFQIFSASILVGPPSAGCRCVWLGTWTGPSSWARFWTQSRFPGSGLAGRRTSEPHPGYLKRSLLAWRTGRKIGNRRSFARSASAFLACLLSKSYTSPPAVSSWVLTLGKTGQSLWGSSEGCCILRIVDREEISCLDLQDKDWTSP